MDRRKVYEFLIFMCAGSLVVNLFNGLQKETFLYFLGMVSPSLGLFIIDKLGLLKGK